MAHMERFMQLFVESMDLEVGATVPPQCIGNFQPPATPPSPEKLERGIEHMQRLLTSEDAMQTGVTGADLAGTFTVLAMALEDQPNLEGAAIRVYKAALDNHYGSTWERICVLQRLGKVCLGQGKLRDALKWLTECSKLIPQADGHPRDEILFRGGLSNNSTRREFAAKVEQLLMKANYDMGDEQQARIHYAEFQKLSKAFSGDVIEQQQHGVVRNAPKATEPAEQTQELWAATPDEERRLTEYRFTDDGPTITVMLELNEHLQIGPEASSAVESLQQFRVNCEADLLDVCLRLRHQGRILHFHMRLHPLAREIIPEDTVPKLRGREGRRRLEVKLFKLDKDRAWHGDLVAKESRPHIAAPAVASDTPKKGTALNPLSPEEIASLPKPSGLKPSESRPKDISKLTASTPIQSEQLAGEKLPSWVAGVDRREASDTITLSVRMSEAAGPAVSLANLELDVDPTAGVKLRLNRPEVGNSLLEMQVPAGTDAGAMVAKWRKKALALELQFPVRCKP